MTSDMCIACQFQNQHAGEEASSNPAGEAIGVPATSQLLLHYKKNSCYTISYNVCCPGHLSKHTTSL
ncbi:hypothetical protein XELAEV_18033125mg [Xenopus laevis]|uniref:Uncharacterized protein n=1 Tax=Xenopus laevis TaxID=8355 RepID=A0A974CJ19_XENLA|nr:hypothetical protein XELAEV_18033125mg [Xenopus laevis]